MDTPLPTPESPPAVAPDAFLLESASNRLQPVVAICRRVKFSSAHFYARDEWSEEKNQQVFYACSNRFGHGHNYGLDVWVEAPLDPDSGMVMNLKDLKTLLDHTVVGPLDHKNLNHQVPQFKTEIPTLENIARWIFNAVEPTMDQYGATLRRLKLVENDELYVELEGTTLETCPMPSAIDLWLTRRYDFCASHRLHNPQWSPEQNWDVYRECNHVHGHGHNYELEVTVSGPPDPMTGMVVDIVKLDEAVHGHLLKWVDHRHLNLDVPFLEGINPTAENLVVAFWEQLLPHVPSPATLARVRLVETKNNVAEYSGKRQ